MPPARIIDFQKAKKKFEKKVVKKPTITLTKYVAAQEKTIEIISKHLINELSNMYFSKNPDLKKSSQKVKFYFKALEALKTKIKKSGIGQSTKEKLYYKIAGVYRDIKVAEKVYSKFSQKLEKEVSK